MDRLTKRQRVLKRDIDEIVDLIGIEFDDIGFIGREWRTPHLERVKDHLIRSAVVLDYALIDEYLDSLLGYYIFGTKKSFVRMWKTKRFRNFNHFILERLYVSQKLDFAKAIQRGIPRDIESAIRKVNDLRNGLAHSFFPEDRRQKLPLFGGHSIYTVDGFKLYLADIRKITRYFRRRLGR